MSEDTARTSLVTGANSGLGKAIAHALADAGDRVFMVVRDRARGEAARSELIDATGNPHLVLLVADLASQQAVRDLAAQVRGHTDRMDLLINNAGTAYPTRGLTGDGVERTLAVNHLAPFLLTRLLLPDLTRAAPARVVNIGTRIDTAMDLDDLNFGHRRYSMMRAYGQSKLGLIHFTRALARRIAGSGVTVHCVFPGFFRSNLGGTDNAQPLPVRLFARLFGWALPSPARRASEVLAVLESAPADALNGAYLGKHGPIRAPAQADDPEANTRVWELSSQMTGLPVD
jgi:NAD(P)-dependent dehydrogenase (short-subunit alcohol dehydrogenase family)